MTPFEYMVLALMLVFSVTSSCKVCASTKLHELPRGFLFLVFLTFVLAVVSFINLVAHSIGG